MRSSATQLGDASSLLGRVLGVAASGTESYSSLDVKYGERNRLDSNDSISKGIEIADSGSATKSKGNSLDKGVFWGLSANV